MKKSFEVFGDHELNTIDQFRVATGVGPVFSAALMPDGHLGYGIPIGGVFAYKDAISPNGVGFDIGCGVKAVKTPLKYDDIQFVLPRIADEIASTVAFGLGRTSDEGIDHPLLEDDRWIDIPKDIRKTAFSQLGTVGSGNHYVDILNDAVDGSIWIAAHFGSRGFGHKTATYFFNEIGAKDGMDAPPSVIEKEKQPYMFDDYIGMMQLAGDYAYAGRDIVVQQVLNILGTDAIETVHNHHNFAWLEEHSGETVWVVRKGATPAFPRQQGFVGGSMGDIAVIVEGREDNPLADEMLWSTVHGAGRIMSRSKAAGKYKKVDGKRIRQSGLVTKQMFDESIEQAGIELRGGGFDESVFVYRKLQGVLDSLGDSITIKHTLLPIVVCMAGAEVKDPYKD